MENEGPQDFSVSGGKILAQVFPYLLALGGIVWGIYSWASTQGGQTSSMQSTQINQGGEISQIAATQKSDETLLYSMQATLAQVQQSVQDIKAAQQHGT
jgi:hypothetical protein